MSFTTSAVSISSLHHHFRLHIPSTFSRAKAPQIFSPHLLRLSTTTSISASNSGDTEESRWLREEQRWLREEQRWLREESRWISERESLLREISILKLRLQQSELELERRLIPLSDSVPQTAISLPSPRSKPLALSFSSSSSSSVDEVQIPSAKEEEIREEAKVTKVYSRTLKSGSEGDEVRDLQEALLKLGFYSGEEEMEYSDFSTGTERAVKTWQASLDLPEDGIMTVALLKRLYSSLETDEPDPLGNANGAAVASVTESSVKQQPATVKKEEKTDIGVFENRVYLLGENRWEEPSRLIGKDKPGGPKKVHGSSVTCIVCRGEGRLMCTECDGTGEPNIEPQFLEWVDEATKCPYCEGQGFIVCDTCEGKSAV